MKQNESITYTERDGILYPDLAVPEQTDYPSVNTDKCGLTS